MKPQLFAPTFIDRVEKELREAPAIDVSTRPLNKQQVITRLRSALEALKKRGYSTEDLVATLNKAGKPGDLHITAATLKNYLQHRPTRAGKTGRASTTRKEGTAAPRPPALAAQPPSPAGVSQPPPAAGTSSELTPAASPHTAPVPRRIPPAPPSAGERKTDQPHARSEFLDTDQVL